MFKIDAGESMDEDLVIHKFLTIKIDKTRMLELETIHGKRDGQRMIKDEIVKFLNESFEKYVQEDWKSIQE